MLVWLFLLYVAQSRPYVLKDDISTLEDLEPAMREYDGSLSVPMDRFSQTVDGEASVGAEKTAETCQANGIYCKCGFQDVKFMEKQLAEKQDCYTLQGVCQHCGHEGRVAEVGFDYKYLPEQKQDVYRLRARKESEIWAPPQYDYQCRDGYVVTGVRSKYTRIATLGDRDFYTLKIKCTQLVGDTDPNLRPEDWKEGEFPWLRAGEEPDVKDLVDSTKTKYVGKGSADTLQKALADAVADPRQPKSWDGKTDSRRILEEDLYANYVDSDSDSDDDENFLETVASDFKSFVAHDPEKKLGDSDSLDSALKDLVHGFADYVDENDIAVEDTDDWDEEALGYGDYDALFERPVAMKHEETDLHPVAVGDDFFDLDDDFVVQEFLRLEEERQVGATAGTQSASEEKQVGSSKSMPFGSFEIKKLNAAAVWSNNILGLGMLDNTLHAVSMYVAKHVDASFISAHINLTYVLGVIILTLAILAVWFLYPKSGDTVYVRLPSELESEDTPSELP